MTEFLALSFRSASTFNISSSCALSARQLPTFIHETAPGFDTIFVSAGRVGFQIELAPEELIGLVGCNVADIV